MIIPGLSSYATEPIKAAESLDQLMDEAVRVVPEKLQGCTKVAVKATAGLRLLGKEASDQILGAVKERLRSRYKFTLAGENAVAIMDGKDEGEHENYAQNIDTKLCLRCLCLDHCQLSPWYHWWP